MKIWPTSVEELFGERQSEELNNMREADRVVIYANNTVVVNMSLVTFLVAKKNAVVFHFVNKTKIVVKRSGDVYYIPNDVASILSEDTPAINAQAGE